MNLPQRWHQKWQEFKDSLNESHIRVKEGSDELIWSLRMENTLQRSGTSS